MHRASSYNGDESMDDPIESSSADEAEAADGGDDFQPSESEAAEGEAEEHSDSWQDEEEEEEEEEAAGRRRQPSRVQPQRRSGRCAGWWRWRREGMEHAACLLRRR